RTAQVWDVARGEPIGKTMVHRDRLYRAVFSPGGKRVATCGWDGAARVWNADTGEPLSPLLKHAERVFHAGFSHDGQRLATVDDAGLLRVWDLTGDPSYLWRLNPQEKFQPELQPPFRPVFSPDMSRVLVPLSGPRAQILDVVTRRPVGLPLEHK